MKAYLYFKKTILQAFLLLFVLSSSYVAAQAKRIALKKYQISTLSDTLNENSGLTFFQNKLLTVNDSGNSSEIFQINTGNGRVKNIYQTGLRNIDWEAISTDSTSIYIGDFGNNQGTRTDLKIFKIKDLNENSDSNSVKEFPFRFKNQSDFTPKNLNTDFDVEAMVVENEKAHIFTKEWVSKQISRYELDLKSNKIQILEKKESIPIGFSATDAFLYENELYVVGYTKKLRVFLAIFTRNYAGQWLTPNFRKYRLGNALRVGQVEGVAVNDDGVYISAERFIFPLKTLPAQLYFIPHRILKK